MRRLFPTAVVLAAISLISTVSALQPSWDEKTRTEVVKIPYEVKYVFDREMGSGRLKKVQFGVDGEVRRTYRVVEEDGKVLDEELVEEERTEPVAAVFHMGKPGNRGDSRGTYTRSKVVTMKSTAYTPDAGRKNPTYTTRTGTRAEFGVIAVDPKVIPLGTLLFVEGYGFGIAEDTGGAIKGNIIDVCIETRKKALAWGRRDVQVHVLSIKVEATTPGETSKKPSSGSD
ncbi:MAG: 3D domain-containing protein [Fimbriimonadaceae bacterium]